MPNRIIKESTCTSDTLASISADAERLWWRLVVQADDYGCFDGRPNVILGKCLTAFIGRFRDSDVIHWLDEMERAGLILRYTVDGKPYIFLCKWGEHQRPPRTKEPKYPLPPSFDNTCCQMTADDNTRQQLTANAPVVGNRDTGIANREAGGASAREDARTPAAADAIHDESVPPIRYYEQTFGNLCPQVVVEALDEYATKGLEASVLKWALREHKQAQARGVRYLRSILERLHQERLFTAEAAEANERERHSRSNARASPPEGTSPGLAAALRSARRRLEEAGKEETA